MPDPLGKRLLAAVLEEKNLEELTKAGFDKTDLFDDARDVYVFIEEYILKHGGFPTPKTVLENTKVKLPDKENPLTYEVEQIRKRRLGKSLQQNFIDATTALEDRDPDKALSIIKTLLSDKRAQPAELVSYKNTGEERLEIYNEVKKTGGYLGAATPWPGVNKLIQAWVNGTMNVVSAKSNTGKTWFSIIISNFALEEEKKVLLVSLETPAFRIMRRLDALRMKIPFGKLRDMELETGEEDDLKERLEKPTFKEDILIADKRLVRTPSDVTSLVWQHKPDLVVIDGAYRFETNARDSKWQGTVQMCNEIQLAAESTDTPWVLTTQHGDASETGKERKRGKKVNAWNVRYGKEFLINADTFIVMHQDTEMRLLKIMELYIEKVRDIGEQNRDSVVRIMWDMKAMNFEEIDPEEEEEESSTPAPGSHLVAF